MTIPMLQVEPGFWTPVPSLAIQAGEVPNNLPNGFIHAAPSLAIQAGLSATQLPQGFISTVPSLAIKSGDRNSMLPPGFLLDNSTGNSERTDAIVPGYVLRKGLRVMTLVDSKVMAFRNLVD